jgi:translation factor SUA5
MYGLKLAQAARAVARGGVVAYPTEGVWGLGCDPWNERAVGRLLALKRRDWRKGLILIGADLEMLMPFLRRPSNTALRRAQASWPGPVTWVFPVSDAAPLWITGEHEGIAVRVTAHPPAVALCRAYGGAIVSTSANRSGTPACLTASAVRLRFGAELDALLPGPLGGLSGPTPIRQVISGALLRR